MNFQSPGMSPEQQRTVVHKRLTVVADDIYKILQVMMGEYEEMEHRGKLLNLPSRMETNVHMTGTLYIAVTAFWLCILTCFIGIYSCGYLFIPFSIIFPSGRLSHFGSDCVQDTFSESRSPSEVWKPSDPPHIKDASTATDSELIHGRPSGPHQTHRAEMDTSTMMDTVAQGGNSQMQASDQEASQHSEAESEDSDEEKTSEANKRVFQDCCKMCGRSFHGSFAGHKIKKHSRKPASTTTCQTTGQSCCRVCGKFFRYRRSFLKHVLQHEQSTDLCGVCGKHLQPDEKLKAHLQTHNEQNSCRDQTSDRKSEEECSDAGSKEGDESDEDWKESGGTDSDDGDSDNEDEMKRETKARGSNKPKIPKNKDLSHLKYCCKVCDKSFCYRASFLKHVQEDERDTILCGVCGNRFESEESLRLHLQTYILTNDCEVCGKHFEGHKQLEMHMRTHTGEKPYVCATCGKSFAQNGNLMGHMRVHTGERPYACSVCGQSFSFKEYMMAHMRIHTGEKPFLCSVCGKGFRQRGTLKTHMMIHTGASTHQCSMCDKTFYKSGALKIHMRSHTGEKPYLCNVCGKGFTASGSLTKHMAAHEGERTHCCSVCGKGFLRKEDLKRHVQTHRDESAHLTSP